MRSHRVFLNSFGLPPLRWKVAVVSRTCLSLRPTTTGIIISDAKGNLNRVSDEEIWHHVSDLQAILLPRLH